MLTALRTPGVFMSSFQRTLRVCITYKCNLSCKACYARGLQQEMPYDMKLSDFAKVVAWMSDKGWRKIRFLGGEATIHPEFIEMLDICYRNKILLTLPTNNLFSKQVLLKLSHPLMRGLDINYSVNTGVGDERREQFKNNLDMLKAKKIPFSFSYIINLKGSKESNLKFYECLKTYAPLYIRVSLELPAFSESPPYFDIADKRDMLFAKIYDMLVECTKLYIPFYTYRPMPFCLFTRAQRMKLRRYSKYIFFTWCPLTYPARVSTTMDAKADAHPD